jgi:sec-independent protein translocase protein TatA
MPFGPTELILILVLVVIFFGVGRLPEVFGAVGKGLREFRQNAKTENEEERSSSAS